jgi:hypothetical protein
VSMAAEYRARAAHCKRMASETVDRPDVRREFENLGQKWFALAQEVEGKSDDTNRTGVR